MIESNRALSMLWKLEMDSKNHHTIVFRFNVRQPLPGVLLFVQYLLDLFIDMFHLNWGVDNIGGSRPTFNTHPIYS